MQRIITRVKSVIKMNPYSPVPLGRWNLAHPHDIQNKAIMDRKIDLANHDSCYCREIETCISHHYMTHKINESNTK